MNDRFSFTLKPFLDGREWLRDGTQNSPQHLVVVASNLTYLQKVWERNSAYVAMILNAAHMGCVSLVPRASAC